MFSRFSSITYEADRLRLGFFWPKLASTVYLRDITSIKLEKDSKGRCELVIIAKGSQNRSIQCFEDANLDRIWKDLERRLANRAHVMPAKSDSGRALVKVGAGREASSLLNNSHFQANPFFEHSRKIPRRDYRQAGKLT